MLKLRYAHFLSSVVIFLLEQKDKMWLSSEWYELEGTRVISKILFVQTSAAAALAVIFVDYLSSLMQPRKLFCIE